MVRKSRYGMVAPVILGSASPRRKELLEGMGISFTIQVKNIEEAFPNTLKTSAIALHIATNKVKAFVEEQNDNIVITADTIVCFQDQVLGKPSNLVEAQKMLQILSGNAHQVYTAVAIAYQNQLHTFVDTTNVYFKTLTEEEIHYYITTYKPLDKAGSYGIQEWIGYIGVQKIEGSYTNVMGLPTEKLYQDLTRFRK